MYTYIVIYNTSRALLPLCALPYHRAGGIAHVYFPIMEITPRNPLPNYQIQDAARQYYRAFEVLEGESRRAILADQEPGFFLPILNAAALTVELYLKSLDARAERYLDSSPSAPQQERQPVGTVKPGQIYQEHARSEEVGHKPAVLFVELDEVIQRQLAAAFASSPLGQQVGSSFKDFLKQYDELFKYSRYAFEEELHDADFPLDPLFALVRFLHLFVENLPPSTREEPVIS